MVAGPFLGWLPEVAAYEVVSVPSNLIAEARGNLWSFAITSAQAAALALADVASFVRAVAEARRRQIGAHGLPAMLFYCWHDAQVAQLRFSLVSADHGCLPFGCPIESTADLESIVESFLELPYHDGISPAGGSRDGNHSDSALPVRVLSLPECRA